MPAASEGLDAGEQSTVYDVLITNWSFVTRIDLLEFPLIVFGAVGYNAYSSLSIWYCSGVSGRSRPVRDVLVTPVSQTPPGF